MWTLENIHVNSIHQLNGSLAAQNAVPGPVAWESPGSLLNIQNFKFTPDLLNQNLQKHCSLLEVKKKKKKKTVRDRDRDREHLDFRNGGMNEAY